MNANRSLSARAFFVTLLLGLASPALRSADQTRSPSHSPLALHEAEILIYVLPVAVDLRKAGNDVAWRLQPNPSDNSDDYFHFWAVESGASGSASPNVGHYAVNRWTGDVWDDVLESPVTGPELERIQAILRKAHGIDARVISDYRSRPLHK